MNLVCQHECNEKAQKRNSVNASQATMEQPSRTIVHAKLEMTNPDSQEEVEADAAANDIVQGGKIARSILAGSSDGGMAVSSKMESRLNSMQGGGQIMPDGLRNMMERGFNRDFSQVRLHTDSEAASLSSSIHAKAFTHGNDIYFNQGQFSPNTSEGQKLIAHELTHVVQRTGKVGREPSDSEAIEQLREKNRSIFNGYVNEVVTEKKEELSRTITKYNNCVDDSHPWLNCAVNGFNLGVAGAALGSQIGGYTGAAATPEVAGAGGIPGYVIGGIAGGAGGLIIGCVEGLYDGYSSSISGDEMRSCMDAEKELSQIDKKADLIKSVFANKLFIADSKLTLEGINYYLISTDSAKSVIRRALSLKHEEIRGYLDTRYKYLFR